jgi:hemolysin III
MESTIGVSHDVHEAPLQPDQEWANALTHGIAAFGTLLVGSQLVVAALVYDTGLAVACGAYVASAFGTFLFSTLSHAILRQPALNTLRAWDQAMIYAMISGTYTPIIYRWAPDDVRMPLLAVIWIAALVGFLHKVAYRHRINSSGTISYLMLGWMPAVPLVGRVPGTLAWWMLAGGVLYSIGVIFLINDRKFRYFHAAWHVSVMTAASCHYLAILYYVVGTA